MKIMKNVLIVLAIILVVLGIVFLSKDRINCYVAVKAYNEKFKDMNVVEKTLAFNKSTNALEENNVDVGDLKVTLSDLQFNNDDKTLNFNLKFDGEKDLYNASYILRVYNDEYCLGDKNNGAFPFTIPSEYIVNVNKFYEKNFGVKFNKIDYINPTLPEENLDRLNSELSTDEYKKVCKYVNEKEYIENGDLVNKITLGLPEQFKVTDKLKIQVLGISYENKDDTTIYIPKGVLNQLDYTININEK